MSQTVLEPQSGAPVLAPLAAPDSDPLVMPVLTPLPVGDPLALLAPTPVPAVPVPAPPTPVPLASPALAPLLRPDAAPLPPSTSVRSSSPSTALQPRSAATQSGQDFNEWRFIRPPPTDTECRRRKT